MSTKAEEFRYWEQRSGAKRPKAGPAARSGAKAAPDARATDRAASRSPRPRAAKKAAYALEVVAPGARPSRKSTRKASNRQRTDTQMRVKLRTQEVRPSSRAALRTS
jgi:hypothetical protein